MPTTRTTSDPRRTTRVVLYENHYLGLGEELEWDVDRFHRLCAALQLTEYELGAMIRMKLAEVSRCLGRNSFPPVVALHLTMLERSIFPNSKPSLFPAP